MKRLRIISLALALTIGGWTGTAFLAGRLGWYDPPCSNGQKTWPCPAGVIGTVLWPIGLVIGLAECAAKAGSASRANIARRISEAK